MCYTPFVVKRDDLETPVPCGRCPKCVARKISEWSFRLMQQEKISDSAYFVTLTYDTQHIPITKNGYKELRKSDVQLFFKRLRKKHETSLEIKYYLVGEYGGRTTRPHYHILIFNAKLELMMDKKDLRILEMYGYDGKSNIRCYQWDKGHITVGEVNGASVGYTLKYISKKGKVPMHRNDDRQPEFSLMSKKLGLNYLTNNMVYWHKEDLINRMYVNLEDGKKAAMPRYYKDKIYDPAERSEVGGFQKGEMEKKFFKGVSKNNHYGRDKREAIKAAFRIMNHNSSLLHNNKI